MPFAPASQPAFPLIFQTFNHFRSMLAIFGLVFLVSGFVLTVIYNIQLIVLAFRASPLWGLGYLFVPFVPLIFIIRYWQDAKAPFLRTVVGAVLLAGGIVMVTCFSDHGIEFEARQAG